MASSGGGGGTCPSGPPPLGPALKVYSSCVRSVMLHAAETWDMKADTLNHLQRNDRAMILWICNVKAKDGQRGKALHCSLISKSTNPNTSNSMTSFNL